MTQPDPQSNGQSKQSRKLAQQAAIRLGEREREVLEVLWAAGGATVQQVAESLDAALAYTTVMTTLDRLYKKHLLLREKRERAFFYQPAISQSELERDRAICLVNGFFSRSALSRDALLSCLVDAVQNYDSDMLQRLEEEVRTAKRQMASDEWGKQGGAS